MSSSSGPSPASTTTSAPASQAGVASRIAPAGLPGLFITGTDTGVGKTYWTASILGHLRRAEVAAGVVKPVVSGRSDPPDGQDDTSVLAEALGQPVAPERISPLSFVEPLAPPVAARRAGRPLLLEDVLRVTREALAWWEPRSEIVLVEGVGGLLCPLAEGATVADLAEALDYPLLIVARRGLGTLNHTLLTLAWAQHRGLRVAGVILNGAEPTRDPLAEQTNAEELTHWLGTVPLLADCPHGRHDLMRSEDIDWKAIAGPPRGV